MQKHKYLCYIYLSEKKQQRTETQVPYGFF